MNLIKKSRYGLMIYNNSDIWVGRSIEKYGEFSESEVQVFRDCIKPGHVVLDIGANIGCHTVAFSRIVGPTGLVFAYEPERTNFTTLCGNISINNIKNVYCHQQAVSDESGSIAVPELDAERTFNYGGLSLDHDYSKSIHYPVPKIKIDNTVFNRLNFIKIDVEGMEKNVLIGGVTNIQKNKPILYVEDDRSDKSEELIKTIKSFNYVLYKHLAPLYNPSNYFENKEDVMINDKGMKIVSSNLFCHHIDVACPIDPQKFCMEKIN